MSMKMLSIIVSVFVLALISAVVLAEPDPQGPAGIIRGDSERRVADTSAGIVQSTQAGNTTPLTINSTVITKRWSGYYGNVSGVITLDDGDNNTLYDWQLATVEGEIYASNGSTVTWANVMCLNFTANTTGDTAEERYNLSTANEFIGLSSDKEQAEYDSVNATFNQTFGDDGSTLEIGSVTINNADNCSMATMYVNSVWQDSNFQEVLLTDNVSIIFAAILEQNENGFQNTPLDFQMIVGVNGTQAYEPDVNPVNYYFFVELT